jgi:hypothetical protein
MGRVWTHAVWTVEPGREDEFVEQWREMARRGMAELATAAPPTLLRDRERENVFISFGPWPDDAEMQRFRAFLRGPMVEMQGVLAGFEPRTLDEVAVGG